MNSLPNSPLQSQNKKRVVKVVTKLLAWSSLAALYSFSVVTPQLIPGFNVTMHKNVGNESFPYFVSGTNIANGTSLNGILTNSERLSPPLNCTPPSIDDFPDDVFTQNERRHGWVVLHGLASLYIFYALALVCDEYFVPCIESMCTGLHLPRDVAGASIMAVGTSSPELFVNLVGTFITKGDIGVGAIVGSAVFNILAVAGISGIVAGKALQLDWYPLSRDCIVYTVSVILLVVFLQDGRVYWYEALFLVLTYLGYLLIMYKNTEIKSKVEKLLDKCDAASGAFQNNPPTTEYQNETNFDGDDWKLFSLPENGFVFTLCAWLITSPARFLVAISVPDCRNEKWKSFYMLTFAMCMVWIGVLSYLVSWLITIIGYTLSIPDSVLGLTFIAAGTSVPEAVSSVAVAKRGEGTMSISNSVGSNTFDVLMCLGLPWLIRASLIASDPGQNYIQINSGGFKFTVMILIVSIFLMYGMLAVNKFSLDKKIGLIFLSMYVLCIALASLLELNVFVELNLPSCPVIKK
ncbi:sodium/potassium/calcium exchanger 4 [Folsomia candida]|uniref:Sodium/potassium/calcium exchanger 5 n=1 Tax=Folsomia candida TaxID=158441 RepID=A0A226DG03_FOLCA|nr:sodium/potassium/calcium exchanger 4 [Folsomia candida]OXA44472.1 Sodium/potassium/calcium exchanger 5 [Folsomia candida]